MNEPTAPQARSATAEPPPESTRCRRAIRNGEQRGPTAGLAPGFVQANLMILPQSLAGEFLLFCQRNPKPCPLLAVGEPGAFTLPVADHWDDLVLRAWIEEDGQRVLYQEGTLASLRHPLELVEGHYGHDLIPEGSAMLCGTVAARGGIRPAPSFEMELFDPVRVRRITHRYAVVELPEVE